MRPTEALVAILKREPTLTPSGFGIAEPDLSPEERANALELQRSKFFEPTGLLAFQQAMDAIRWRPSSDCVNYAVSVSAIAAGAHVRSGVMIAALLSAGFRVEREGAEAYTNLAVNRRAMARTSWLPPAFFSGRNQAIVSQ